LRHQSHLSANSGGFYIKNNHLFLNNILFIDRLSYNAALAEERCDGFCVFYMSPPGSA
jgi:hypothetical protein